MPSLPHINFKKITNKNVNNPFTKVFDIDTKFTKFIKNDVEYYRINLQHNGEYDTVWEHEELLNHIGSSIYIYIPTNSVTQESIQFGLDKFSSDSKNESNHEYNIHFNINIHDRVGIFNVIKQKID
jgi:spermidine/putrescine-binding protein